ncbi:hypothetical protein [Rossellomorea marisflavi]|uniref:hypothetical protein n=1 Tax=Rossellomorea marisflavi TaxID=189381 RepID=UPI0035699D36
MIDFPICSYYKLIKAKSIRDALRFPFRKRRESGGLKLESYYSGIAQMIWKMIVEEWMNKEFTTYRNIHKVLDRNPKSDHFIKNSQIHKKDL